MNEGDRRKHSAPGIVAGADPRGGGRGRRSLVLLASLLGLSLLGCSSPTEEPGADRVVTVSGEPLTVLEADGTDGALGTRAPALAGADYAGNPVEFTPGQDPATLVVFVAHWCPHCQAELPVIVDWLASGADVPVLLVSTAHAPDRGNWSPEQWLAREGWSGPVIADDDALAALNAYGMNAFPAFVVVGSDGSVLARTAGPLGTEGLDQVASLLSSGTR